jgi:putative proteasome-type protease
MDLVMKVDFLAFDATRTGSTSVEYPIEVALDRHGTFDIVELRSEKEHLAEISSWWQSRIYDSVEKLPSKWVDRLLESPPRDASASSKNSSDTSSS